MQVAGASYASVVASERLGRVQLFARELRPGWTSWGNDCLRFQTLDRFTMPEEAADS